MRNEKIALVTGANKGIGFEVARQLARLGWHVFLSARNVEAGRGAASKITEGRVDFLELDVSQPESMRRAADELSRAIDRLDVLINNAGICLDEDKSALTTTPEIFETTLRTNALGPWLVAQTFLPLLRKSAAPRIVNVSSGGGQLADGADGWAPAYCVSKTALNGVTAQLAAALPKFAVNSVCPGWVRTDMGGENATRSVGEERPTSSGLAVEAPHDLTGRFVKNRKVIPW
ncbi:MAG TPA: SDR family oxidoreductase [Chthoniobacterales bacterium]|jgi:NAD(P)-dependent dehydrogenase (short-subunit alcohol dehydrogenase family)